MKYHFIGNMGISMSAIASFLASRGHKVGGSDLKNGGHKASNITADIDVVVRTSAVNPGSPGWAEVEAAEKIGIPIIKRSELLGQITDQYELIAISGMHGKTTTSSLAGLVMIEAGLDPTVLIGEKIHEFDDSPLRIGESKYFVMEACEYDRSFLDFRPSILILTNIDEEHLDTYPGGIPEIKAAFTKYIGNVRKDGLIIANYEDPELREILQDPPVKVIWYGKGSDKYNRLDAKLSIGGDHNRLNALAVVALADHLEIDRKFAKGVFESFRGAKRRLEYWGELNSSLLFDDYGHHPTELQATIKALKDKYQDYRIAVIFWPHQYKRILPLFDKFAASFDLADLLFLKKIYFVPGRDEVLDVSSEKLADAIRGRGIETITFEEDEQIVDKIKEISNQKFIFLSIGIPPIYKIWERILGE